MKRSVICLLVICAAVVAIPVEGVKYIDFGALNPCMGPNPPPGCNPPGSHHKKPVPANEYRRGCTTIHRCRRD
ncbi:protein RALF-like 11 [Raphanus sativus]|uniref:Protein RALF-like 11 n=1 Tax=Raphanus sativus TaxID=3726 RepID=A0A6J0JU92_RAPSA|nr:protein RALF-like 11 [Raphanus sativus]XP_056844704.1 protein RALF-like 11 [Raphanus sativus]XP_056856093.1 protein RALF-like 11 [Raphanus sativus]